VEGGGGFNGQGGGGRGMGVVGVLRCGWEVLVGGGWGDSSKGKACVGRKMGS